MPGVFPVHARLAFLVWLAAFPSGAQESGAAVEPEIVVPRLWDEAALADWATPLAGLGRAPAFYSDAEYYVAPIDNLRTYPVYHPDFEPEGYREALVARGPQPLIVSAELHSKADW